MRKLAVLCGLGCATLLCPPGARAEPISLALNGGTGGFAAKAETFTHGAVRCSTWALSRSTADPAR